MTRLQVTVLDLVSNGSAPSPFSRVMNANRASIMPQAVAVWCESAGHSVRFLCYTGVEDLERELSGEMDLLIVGSFTRSAQLAYAVSHLCRQRGAVTVLGGPHARAYPEDAVKYFDYVLGLTDRALIEEVLKDAAPQRPEGLSLSAARQPRSLPSVRERWKFIEPTLARARILKLVPTIGSMGCPSRKPRYYAEIRRRRGPAARRERFPPLRPRVHWPEARVGQLQTAEARAFPSMGRRP